MARFEKEMKRLFALSSAEQDKFIAANKPLCSCPTCSTYGLGPMGGEALYCLFGKSPTCVKNLKVCACKTCLIHSRMGLSRGFFCARGSEAEQRMKNR